VSALFSASWYRAAELRPRLRRQARITRHSYRGERWYVLQDLGSGRFLRLNPAAYRLVALMDGVRTLDEIWRNVCLNQGDDAPTQDEVLQLLARLHEANVLLSDRRPDLGELEERRTKTRAAKLKQYLSNPLSLRIPLVDPDPLLTAVVSRMPGSLPVWLSLWFLVFAGGVAGVTYHWQELTHDIAAHVFNAQNVLWMALAFPMLKIIHELGHGIAIKAFGGACREMGVMFLVFFPVPYVDASQASGFPDKTRRILVGAAGMMAEIAMACAALLLWSWTQPGLAKAFLHEVVIIAGVTTLVFNLNPLLRFDGYYMLADWLEIPNLGQKANQYVGYLFKRYLVGAREVQPPRMTAGEPAWLLGYATGSFAYRMLVAVTIILLVAEQFFFIGVLLAAWGGWIMLVQPLLRSLGQLARTPDLERHRWRAWTVTAGLTALAASLVFFVPAPSWTSAEGVIWMPDDARLRAAHPCFGRAVLAEPGGRVARQAPLLGCSDPELDAQIAQAEAFVSELQARRAVAVRIDRVQMQTLSAELRHGERRLADLLGRREVMTIRSPHDGVFVMPSPADFPGRFHGRA
jgi:putative peptide zinc metalloprotease protein